MSFILKIILRNHRQSIRGSILIESMLAMFCLSAFIMGLLQMIGAGENATHDADRRIAIAGELAHQLREARSIPITILLHGGTTPQSVNNADGTTRYALLSEPWFSTVGFNNWYERPQVQLLSSFDTGPKLSIKWRMSQLSLSDITSGYQIEVEVTLPHGNSKSEDLIITGKVFRSLENGT